MGKIYLAFFALPKPQREHARIRDVIQAAAVGEIKQFPLPGGVGFLYESDRFPWQLDFARILMNGDSKMVVEVGDDVCTEGFGAAAGWLNARRPRR